MSFPQQSTILRKLNCWAKVEIKREINYLESNKKRTILNPKEHKGEKALSTEV